MDKARVTLQGSLAPLMSAEATPALQYLRGATDSTHSDKRHLHRDLSP